MTIHQKIAQHLLAVERVLFITGAGISADSGLPTYRGLGGLYEETQTSEGYSIEEALSGEMLAAHPEITWKYLLEIEHNCRGAKPNRAHEVIANLERYVPSITVYTQNIDGLHIAANSSDVIEIHGDLYHLHCTHCDYNTHVTDYQDIGQPPLCPRCLAPIRPKVVLFGEPLPQTALRHLDDAFNQSFDLVFSIGTSSLFPYIVEPVIWACQAGIPTVEINPGETILSNIVDYRIQAGAAETMDKIWQSFLAEQ